MSSAACLDITEKGNGIHKWDDIYLMVVKIIVLLDCMFIVTAYGQVFREAWSQFIVS